MSGKQFSIRADELPERQSATASQADVRNTWIRSLIWLTMAVSSIVLLEPAPYDILAAGLFSALFLLGLRVPRSLAPGVFLLALFVMANLLSVLVAEIDADGMRSLAIRVYLPLTWVLFASLVAANPTRAMRVIWSGYGFAALLAAAWGIGQYYGYLPFYEGQSALRAAGAFKDANVFGPFLVPVTLLFVALMTKVRKLGFALIAIGFIICLVGILLSFSRGAWLNAGAALAVLTMLLIAEMRSHRAQMKLFLLTIVLAFIAVASLNWLVDNTSAGQMFAQRATLVQDYDVAVNGRFAAQSSAIGYVAVDPIGVGPGMSPNLLGGMEPHNIYLHIALESGWLGLLSFVGFVLLSLWRGVSSLRSVDPSIRTSLQVVVAAVIGILLQSLFIDSTHWRHMWLLLALLWGLTAAQPDRQERVDDYVK